MDTRTAYNDWSKHYDTNLNKTRDLEAQALKAILEKLDFEHCLEIGCGTGKNTHYLLSKSQKVKAVDFSEEMLAKAKEKITSDAVEFQQADINDEWNLGTSTFDLITFSLVLEHIENLDHIFHQISKTIKKEGRIYIGELHPIKQYSGSKARFETAQGTQVLECFTHHTSDFINAAKKHNFHLEDLQEHFDDNDRNNIPRILTLVFSNSSSF